MTVRRLPLLEQRRAELELCVYCPKLCRAACPVSNAEPREVLIPWGKMSTAYFMARGMAAADAPHAATAWACTGCGACGERRCDHHNDVAGTLLDARAWHFDEGRAPGPARRVAERFARHGRRARQAAERLGARLGAGREGRAFLAGCAYARALPGVALDAARVARAFAGPVRPLGACCGRPLLEAGDRAGFVEAARAFVREAGGPSAEVLALDPGCARTLIESYPQADPSLSLKVTLLVDVVASELGRLRPLEAPPPAVRYHDPCHLGRGLGRFDGPRALIARLTGRAPAELPDARRASACSGGGGLLPATMPEVAGRIARARAGEHRAAGGGTLVTACASSTLALRRAGEGAVDLFELVARGLGGA
ncbi:MAG TPA: (Fe-S)-binding protein [Polyangiaceae bacterium]|nr:(Fe-S)-binding protein [Polyangiaceae bacterium]